jgi:hypothetical protein
MYTPWPCRLASTNTARVSGRFVDYTEAMAMAFATCAGGQCEDTYDLSSKQTKRVLKWTVDGNARSRSGPHTAIMIQPTAGILSQDPL